MTQIGDSNNAGIRQAAARGYANIHQEGDHNAAEVTQDDNGVGYVDARQTGDLNVANITQGGVGHNIVYLTQNGINNRATSVQLADGVAFNGAILPRSVKRRVGKESVRTCR